MEFIFLIAILIFSIVIHEVSHGVAANYLGDPTAKHAGRLTLNPLRHLDFFGFVIIPLITYFAWGFPVGAAKPVPYNPYNLNNQKYGSAIVGAAGPASNLLIALIFGLSLRYMPFQIIESFPAIAIIFSMIIFLNLLLAAFNLLPIPPLDGSKIFFVFLPSFVQEKISYFGQQIQVLLARYWIFIILILFLLAPYILRPIFFIIFIIITPIYEFLGGVPFP